MQKMRIYKIAKQAKMSTKELMNILEQLDIKAKSHMSNLENNELNLILEYLNLDNLIEKKPRDGGLKVKIAVLHDVNAVGQAHDHDHVVLDQKHGQIHLASDFQHQMLQSHGFLRVHTGGGLVQKQQE